MHKRKKCVISFSLIFKWHLQHPNNIKPYNYILVQISIVSQKKCKHRNLASWNAKNTLAAWNNIILSPKFITLYATFVVHGKNKKKSQKLVTSKAVCP